MGDGILLISKLQKIFQKIQSFAHGEFNKAEIANKESIKLKVEKGQDIFDRGLN